MPREGKVKVHADWFDPDNPKGNTKQSPLLNVEKHGQRDNHGEITSLSPNPLVFMSATNKVSIATCTIDPAHAGDNYIVAVHPNSETLSKYRFKSTNGKILQRPNNSGGWVNLVQTMQTEMLTVWRTLWIELDQMYVSNGRVTSRRCAFDNSSRVATPVRMRSTSV